MGNHYSSSSIRGFANLNNAVTPDNTLSSVTKWSINFSKQLSQGYTVNCFGGVMMVPDFRAVLLPVVFVLNYNTIDIGKQKADEMAVIVNRRHGYENFESMSAADRSRVKSYVRGELLFGGLLHEPARYSPEERAALASNSIKLATATA